MHREVHFFSEEKANFLLRKIKSYIAYAVSISDTSDDWYQLSAFLTTNIKEKSFPDIRRAINKDQLT